VTDASRVIPGRHRASVVTWRKVCHVFSDRDDGTGDADYRSVLTGAGWTLFSLVSAQR
jgi:hypothetical protein